MKDSAFEKGKRMLLINVLRQKIFRQAIAAIALVIMLPLQADDTEIFFGDAAADPNLAQPMVMLSLDWRSNLGSVFCNTFDADCEETLGEEISDQLKTNGFESTDTVTLFDALRAVFEVVLNDIENFDIGFMLNHENSCTGNPDNGSYFSVSDECSNGGYILRRFRDVNETGSVQEIIDKLDAMPLPQGAEHHKYQGLELFYEFYRYLTGQGILNGHNGFGDYASQNPKGTPDKNLDEAGNLNKREEPISTEVAWDDVAEERNALDALTGDYLSPYEEPRDFSCGKVYTINVMFQVSQQENDTDDPLGESLEDGGLDMPSNSSFPDIIGELYGLDHADSSIGDGSIEVEGIQNVTSYFIVDKVNNKTLEYAQAGGTGNPYSASEDPKALLETFRRLFDDIATDPSSFVAVSVPVNVQNRVQSLDQLFLALFSVQENGHTLWPGNIKKLRVNSEEVDVVDDLGQPTGETDTVITIVDQLDSLAFDATDGLISNNALTFWTDSDGDDVDTADPDLNEISGKDGRSVMRGGAGQQVNGVMHKSGTPESSVGLDNTGSNRKVFIEPESFDASSTTGTDVTDLNVAALKSEGYIQKLLGVRILDPDGNGTTDYIDDTDLIAEIEARSGETGLTAEETTEILLEWVRGLDVFDGDGDGNKTEARSWLMGDVLHSRPLTLNFGETDSGCLAGEVCNPDVRLAFGTNNGFFNFIQSTLTGATVTQSGQENWTFMPLEMLPKVTTFIKEVDVGIDREYGVDGGTASLVIDNNDDGVISRTDNDISCTPGTDNCDKTYLYFGLRRGGKSYYALDASNADDDPQLLWKVSKTVGGDFDELGMTFSDPVVGWVRYEDVAGQNVLTKDGITANVPVPVIMVGGGYFGGVTDGEVSGANSFDYSNHQGKDCLITGTSPVGATACDNTEDDEGNAIYLIHARTGELIWKVTLGNATGAVSATEYQHDELKHSIPARITPFDSNGNNIYDRIYVGDTGGNIWRVDMPEYFPAVLGASDDHREDNWKVTKLASFGGTGADDRRFFHSLSVVKASDVNGPYDGVVAVSGDRAHPKSQTGVNNKIYLIKDRDVTAGSIGTKMTTLPITDTYLTDVTNLCLNDVDESDGQCSESGNLKNGWRFDLGIDDGEKGLSQPIVIGSRVLFTTYVPNSDLVEDSCGPDIGQSYLYQVSLKDGSPAQFAFGEVQPPGLTIEDRYIILHAGIDGGVTPVSPEALLAQPKVISTGNQRPIPLFWREKGVDILDDGS
jgi:type IV pilus assembly protein PilY1